LYVFPFLISQVNIGKKMACTLLSNLEHVIIKDISQLIRNMIK